ncbi:hypothetical protein PVK06_019590 [Gossypium arboreum]|uniref:Uncharacterized protein n=1 Tax=Gossypium arboreum TaxID=29729 RepID=A0ABR0PK57_GOSAR|nr:hypothetical protein PVK06_019590 [Gossypium arboreum]
MVNGSRVTTLSIAATIETPDTVKLLIRKNPDYPIFRAWMEDFCWCYEQRTTLNNSGLSYKARYSQKKQAAS